MSDELTALNVILKTQTGEYVIPYTNKQDVLVEGQGIDIDENNIISVDTSDIGLENYVLDKTFQHEMETKADDDNVVHKDNEEEITGKKIFTGGSGSSTIDASIQTKNALAVGDETQTAFTGIYNHRKCTSDNGNVNTAGFLVNSDGSAKFVHKKGTPTEASQSDDSYIRFDSKTLAYSADAKTENNILHTGNAYDKKSIDTLLKDVVHIKNAETIQGIKTFKMNNTFMSNHYDAAFCNGIYIGDGTADTNSRLYNTRYCNNKFQLVTSQDIGYNPMENTIATDDYGLKYQVKYKAGRTAMPLDHNAVHANLFLSYKGLVVGYSGDMNKNIATNQFYKVLDTNIINTEPMNLTTTDKTITGAINELHTKISDLESKVDSLTKSLNTLIEQLS